MIVTETIRAAKCKDCKFCQYIKQRHHECQNPSSGRNRIALNDLVCDKWWIK
jgi:hypothetical protein